MARTRALVPIEQSRAPERVRVLDLSRPAGWGEGRLRFVVALSVELRSISRSHRAESIAGQSPLPKWARQLLFKAAENVRATASRPFLLQPKLIRSLHSGAPLIR
jgi:hypothetical protein